MSSLSSRFTARAGSPAARRPGRSHLALITVVTVVFAGLLATGPARAQCPQSALGVGCFDIVMEFVDASSARAEGGSWTAGTPCSFACFDVAAGALHAANAFDIYSGACASDVQLVDDYQLVGAPVGPPISFEAVLQVTGAITTAGSIHIQLYDPTNVGAAVDFGTLTPSPVITGSVVLPLVLSAGQTVRLVSQLDAAGLDSGLYTGGAATADAVLRFGGLPPGVSVTSCRAYDLPVPTRTTSWGMLKATYR